jgi:hypothetical protein
LLICAAGNEHGGIDWQETHDSRSELSDAIPAAYRMSVACAKSAVINKTSATAPRHGRRTKQRPASITTSGPFRHSIEQFSLGRGRHGNPDRAA